MGSVEMEQKIMGGESQGGSREERVASSTFSYLSRCAVIEVAWSSVGFCVKRLEGKHLEQCGNGAQYV